MLQKTEADCRCPTRACPWSGLACVSHMGFRWRCQRHRSFGHALSSVRPHIDRTLRSPLVPPTTVLFLPRCMKCRRGQAMRILSVCLSVTRVYC